MNHGHMMWSKSPCNGGVIAVENLALVKMLSLHAYVNAAQNQGESCV